MLYVALSATVMAAAPAAAAAASFVVPAKVVLSFTVSMVMSAAFVDAVATAGVPLPAVTSIDSSVAHWYFCMWTAPPQNRAAGVLKPIVEIRSASPLTPVLLSLKVTV